MISSLYRILKAALVKGATFVFIAALALLAHGLWLFVHDPSTPENARAARLTMLAEQRTQLEASSKALDQRLEELRSALATQRERNERAGRTMEALAGLQSRWERWFGNKEQQDANARQIEHLRSIQKETRGRITELERTLRASMRERFDLDEALETVDRDFTTMEKQRSPLVHYALVVWRKDRWWLVAGAVVYFLGGFLLRALIYFIFAPTVVKGRPLWFFKGEPGPQPTASESARELGVALWPGEVLRVLPEFFVAADASISQRRRWFIDGRMPFTSLLAGWVRPLELHHRHAGGESRVQLAVPEAAASELVLVQVPEGGSFIARPSQIAGVVCAASSRLAVRRRWRPFHWQSWATLQFRFFEFVGPCRLVLCGRRPLRSVRLLAPEPQLRAVRRLPKRATVGFSPSLEYHPVRADRFWAYSRGRAALFDSALTGAGIVVYQEPAYTPSSQRQRLRSARNAVLRLLGV